MTTPGFFLRPQAAPRYQEAQENAVSALMDMTMEMTALGAEHVRFHKNFNEAQKRIQDMKKAYAPKELDAEVIRATALAPYVSKTNISSVTALGHYEIEKALGTFQKQEKELHEIHKKTAELMDTLLEDRDSKGGNGHDVKAESVDEVERGTN